MVLSDEHRSRLNGGAGARAFMGKWESKNGSERILIHDEEGFQSLGGEPGGECFSNMYARSRAEKETIKLGSCGREAETMDGDSCQNPKRRRGPRAVFSSAKDLRSTSKGCLQALERYGGLPRE